MTSIDMNSLFGVTYFVMSVLIVASVMVSHEQDAAILFKRNKAFRLLTYLTLFLMVAPVITHVFINMK